jgi:ribosome-binding factor A
VSRRRIERLNEQLKREVVEILRREVRDPRVGPVTITEVETSPDLAISRLFVHAMEEDAALRAELMEGLRAAAPFIRGEVGRRLHIRRSPELVWVWDETFEYAQRIEKLLAQVRPADVPDEEDPDVDGD